MHATKLHRIELHLHPHALPISGSLSHLRPFRTHHDICANCAKVVALVCGSTKCVCDSLLGTRPGEQATVLKDLCDGLDLNVDGHDNIKRI